MSGPSNNGRKPPAFQCYAADWLADRHFKAMNAAERGVLFSMLNECWCNGSVPAAASELSRVLGLESDETKGALNRVRRYFEARNDPELGAILICPQLDAYRQRLDDRLRRQSEGGRKGAEGKWHRGHANGLPNGHPNGSLNRTEQSREKQSVYKGGANQDEFSQALEGDPPFVEEARRRSTTGNH